MKRNFFVFIASCLSAGIFFTTSATAAKTSKSVALICDMERLIDKEKLKFSVVLDEADRLAIINGARFVGSQFTAHEVNGEMLYPYGGVDGLSRSVEFSLDRISGNLVYTTVPKADNGKSFSDEQLEKISAEPAGPAFIGTCNVSKPMF